LQLYGGKTGLVGELTKFKPTPGSSSGEAFKSVHHGHQGGFGFKAHRRDVGEPRLYRRKRLRCFLATLYGYVDKEFACGHDRLISK
jgi:hypothetical protein